MFGSGPTHRVIGAPEPTPTEHPYRIAFVGDSFTEGMQVEYDKTFCALIEHGLAGRGKAARSSARITESRRPAYSSTGTASRMTSYGPTRPMLWSSAFIPGMTSLASSRPTVSSPMAALVACITQARPGPGTFSRG